MDNTYNVEDKSHASDVLARLDRFRKNQQYCDFKIKCSGQEILVHKCIIAASSDYFDAMLSHDTIENQNGVVELKEVDHESVTKCVDFMYTGKAVVSEEKQVNLIHVASILQLHKLCYQIGNAMKADMDIKSFFTIRKIAVMYGLDTLSEACNLFAAENFCSLMKMEEFRDLEAKYLESLITSPYLNLIADVKCKALMNWIENDSNRVASLFDLMKLIDISKVQVSYRKFLLNVPIIFNSPQCLEYIMNSIPDENDEEATDFSEDCSLKILSFNPVTRNIDCFGPIEDDSSSEFCSADKAEDLQFTCLVAFGNYLYLVSQESSFFRLNFLNKSATWEKLSSPNRLYVDSCQPALLNGGLYLWGGHDLDRYSFSADHWSEIPKWKLFDSDGACMTSAHGKLIIISGENFGPDEVFTGSDAACYDPSTSTWSSLSSLRKGRSNASACTHMNIVYVLGGITVESSENLESVEILYSLDSQWELVELDRFGHSCFLSYGFNGKIYLVGGDDFYQIGGNVDDETVAVFEPKTKSWQSEIAYIPARKCKWEDHLSVVVVL